MSLNRIGKIVGNKEKYSSLAKSSRHHLFFPFSWHLAYYTWWSDNKNCIKMQKYPLVCKTAIQGMKPLNSKLNRGAASDSLDGCNFPKDSWVSSPESCAQRRSYILWKDKISPMMLASAFISYIFSFDFSLQSFNCKFISPAYLKTLFPNSFLCIYILCSV